MADVTKLCEIAAAARALMHENVADEEKCLECHLGIGRHLLDAKNELPRGAFLAWCTIEMPCSASWCAKMMKATKFANSPEFDNAKLRWPQKDGGEPRSIEQIVALQRQWRGAQDVGKPKDSLPSKQRRTKEPPDLAARCAELMIENGALLSDNSGLRHATQHLRRCVLALEDRLARSEAGSPFITQGPLLLPYREAASLEA